MAFPRPKRTHQPPAWRTATPSPQQSDAPPADEIEPRANGTGTLIALAGILLTGLFMTGKTASEISRFASFGVGISIAISVAMDFARGGVRNLIRTDMMAIASYYFLTLFEFWFRQPIFDQMIGVRLTRDGLIVVLIGLAGLLIGRHYRRRGPQPFRETFQRDVPPSWIVTMVIASFVLAFAHQLVAVNFSFYDWIDRMIGPRFTQPWQRGRLGDWRALLVELQLFMYLIPPLAGIVLARPKRYGFFQIAIVVALFAFTVGYGFVSGTRNVFAAFLVTSVIGYAFAMPDRNPRRLVMLSIGAAALMCVATVLMLQFRSIGFKAWINGEYVPPDAEHESTLFVDYNLYAISMLVDTFPRRTDYLGFEVPYLALVRPIPRALWPGKPEGLSKSIEDALGVEGLTIAASFAGEAYIAGGRIAVFVAGLFFGALASWWTSLASSRNSELGILIYSSGFFAAVISMRSLFVFTTALLPTAAALVIGSWAVRHLASRTRMWLARPAPIKRSPIRRP